MNHNFLIKCFVAFVLMSFPLLATAAKFKIEDGPELDIWGQAQLQAEVIDTDGDDDGLKFNSDRIRFGTKMKWGNWKLAFQFNAKDTKGDGGEGALGDDSFIRDAVATYKLSDQFAIKVGQYKTPLGMAQNMSGTRLPMMKRTLTSRLVLDRTLGASLTGRYIGGDKKTGSFGYDFGIFNPAGRSQAYDDSNQNAAGDTHSYVGRLVYDYGKILHFEAAYAEIEDAGCSDAAGFNDATLCTDSEDYEVFDLGAMYKRGPVRIRAEYIDGENVKGVDGFDEQSWFVEGGYKFTDMVEAVIRHQESECDDCGGAVGTDEELSRTEVGLNFFLGPTDRTGRIQLYYANVGDDEEDYSGVTGGGDNDLDMVGAQLQMMF